MAKPTRLYGEITKSEKQDDGTLMVYGYASSEIIDSDGETVTADAMKNARDGYMAFANVREMHDPKKAAGVATEYEVQEDGRTWFGAHVVDPVAVLKCETGVYKGFSIGAKVPKGGRDGKVIKSIELREISLVDRPANPEAVFTLVKADGAADEADDAEDGQQADEIKKGLYELRDFADVLRSIGYLVSSAGYEAQYEGDNSPLPAAMLEWLNTGVELFKSMAIEETAELLANLKAAVPAGAMAVDVIAAADAGGDLQKAGKKFSAATKAALKAAHDACKAADSALAALKYDGEAEDEGDADDTGKAATTEGEDEIAKAAKATEEAETLAKAERAAQVDEIAKAAGLELAEPTQDELTKAAITALVGVRAELAELKKRAATPKGYANGAAVTITKAADRDGHDANEPEPVIKADGTVDEVATLIKAAQAKPIRI